MKMHKRMKLIIPLLILLVISGIWFVKKNVSSSGIEANSISNNDAATEDKAANNDFSLEVTEINLATLKAFSLPIMLDFGADTCPPCKAMAGDLKKINEEMQGKALVKFVDVWKHTAVSNDFPIKVIPTQIFINADGTPYKPSENIDITFDIHEDDESNEHLFTVHQGKLTFAQMQLILADMGVSSD